MIVVYVDRDSVAMGDDVDSHVERWEFEDHAAPGDVLSRVLSGSYLARVAGTVAWGFEVGEFTLRSADGGVSLRPGRTLTLAAVLQPSQGDASSSVVVLNQYLMVAPFLTRPDWAVGDREFAVQFRYSSGGAALSPSAFASWVAQNEPGQRSRVARLGS